MGAFRTEGRPQRPAGLQKLARFMASLFTGAGVVPGSRNVRHSLSLCVLSRRHAANLYRVRFRELLIPVGRTEAVGAVQGVIGRRRGRRRDVQTSREPGEVPGPVRERADAGRGDRKIHGAAPDRFVAVACVEDTLLSIQAGFRMPNACV